MAVQGQHKISKYRQAKRTAKPSMIVRISLKKGDEAFTRLPREVLNFHACAHTKSRTVRFAQIEQWQFRAPIRGPVTTYFTPPQRQIPLAMRSSIYMAVAVLKAKRTTAGECPAVVVFMALDYG
jgi:hypothetical protein